MVSLLALAFCRPLWTDKLLPKRGRAAYGDAAASGTHLGLIPPRRCRRWPGRVGAAGHRRTGWRRGSRLLGFDLLPRIKRINKVRLHRQAAGEPDVYRRLAPALTRPIRWDIVAEQYDQMIKYAAAYRLFRRPCRVVACRGRRRVGVGGVAVTRCPCLCTRCRPPRLPQSGAGGIGGYGCSSTLIARRSSMAW